MQLPPGKLIHEIKAIDLQNKEHVERKANDILDNFAHFLPFAKPQFLSGRVPNQSFLPLRNNTPLRPQ
jgi:hypothetical protein